MEGKYDNKLISLGLSLRGDYGYSIYYIKIIKIYFK